MEKWKLKTDRQTINAPQGVYVLQLPILPSNTSILKNFVSLFY